MVYVDVVNRQAGHALITGPGFSGRVGRTKPRRFYVEDTDTEQLVAEVSSYAQAGRELARAHGLTAFAVEIDYED